MICQSTLSYQNQGYSKKTTEKDFVFEKGKIDRANPAVKKEVKKISKNPIPMPIESSPAALENKILGIVTSL